MSQASSSNAGPTAATKPHSSRSEHRRRFECTYAGCGRHYSRAEHLYRHQLNHNPKEIFKCDFPGCSRTFVRQDLCIRHRERHESRGKLSLGQNSSTREPLSPRSSVSDDATSPSRNTFPPPMPVSNTVQPSMVHRSSFSEPKSKPMEPPASVSQASPDLSRTTSHQSQNPPPVQPLHDSSASPVNQTSLQSGIYGLSRIPSGAGLPHERSLSFSDAAFNILDSNGVGKRPQAQRAQSSNENKLPESSMPPFSIASFGEQSFNDSPNSIRDEFTAWLFDDGANLPPTGFPMGVQSTLGFQNFNDSFSSGIYTNYFADPALENAYPGMMFQRQPEPANKLPELSNDTSLLSYSKRKALLTLMEFRFNDSDNLYIRQLREEIFQGNLDAEEHVLSVRSLQHYIGSYWYHFHAQMPILHQPTFSADDTHEFLLLAVMAIGAAYLNKAHGRQVTDAAARLATFIAWHLRWQVFMHNDFHPPAKLWVFQTLLLLEVYEKMNATRALHERSHIHYATTINLMRRGTNLIETHPDGSRAPSTPEEWWSRWIKAEATRRAAYAAFYLDAVHATMFGHAAMMVVHEIRLPLPCDDALWSATSAAEVSRVEASLHANGVKPTTFLDGLKKTLTGRKVRTNNFGRMILMAGLMSVAWHMNQRDLQVTSLGVSQSMGVPGDGWRNPLTKAFEFWKKDFDESIEHMRKASLPWQKPDAASGEEDMAKAANMLHHLSHMTMHVDIMDCQIFAGTKRLFGRNINNSDYERVKSKMFEWAKGPGARVAVFHALQLLKPVISVGKDGSKKLYSARDDYILTRPWNLYFAALVVWCYGFALDGVLRPFPSLIQASVSPNPMSNLAHASSHSMLNMAHDGSDSELDVVVKDAQAFFSTIGGVKTPQALESFKDGRNNIVGVLAILELAFRDSRWELLHEAANLLRNAIMLLRGANRT
ncbi:hypothetical protein B0A52_01159 [Exophiala mesophila]|uniref:C2H2-type domain-containing protein n=1 Tax=Exophiala mesophila TaxID=212818 RepID=A0A438NGN3_EXOME|nr:hypothetical protein B0A52_01159 [Exophiala mesophila]